MTGKAALPEGLPANAYRAFKGQIFEVWQWEQVLYDGTTHTFEKARRCDTAQIIPVAGENILLLEQEQPHRRKPFISLAGGQCGWSEDPLAAAKRELREETGCEAGKWQLWFSERPYEKLIWNIYTYIARDCRKVGKQKLDAGEKITVRPYTFEQFLGLIDEPSFRGGTLEIMLTRARYDGDYREELRKTLKI